MRRRDFAIGVLPSVALMLGLLALPLLYSVLWSFQRVSYGQSGVWIGFSNYSRALGDPLFRTAVGFTVVFAIVDTTLQLVLGYLLALLMNRARRGRSVFLGLLLVPFVIPSVIAATAFSWLFDSSFGGLANFFLEKLTGHSPEWFTSTWPNRTLIILEALWAGVPFIMLVLLGALKGMSNDQIEASIVDGANWWQRQRYVFIPSLAPMLRFLAMSSILADLGLFDSLIPLSPNAQTVGTQSVALYVYQEAFARDQQNLGLGSAVNVMMIIVMFILISPFIRQTVREIVAK